MSKGRKTGGRDFVPGDPRAGRKPLPPELKGVRRLNKTELETIVNKYLWTPDADLEATASNPALPPVERWVVSIIHRGLSTGEWHGFEWIAQRLIGKVQEKVEVTLPKPFVVNRLDGTQTVMGAVLPPAEDELPANIHDPDHEAMRGLRKP